MLLPKNLLHLVLGKPEGGELVELPKGAHVSSKGGLRIESDKLYADEAAFDSAAKHTRELYDAELGN